MLSAPAHVSSNSATCTGEQKTKSERENDSRSLGSYETASMRSNRIAHVADP
jgi:hypothetical protein